MAGGPGPARPRIRPLPDRRRRPLGDRHPQAGRRGGEAPHIAVAVFARGLLDRVPTRIYFGDEEAANAGDPLLSSLDPERRATLVATAEDGGYRFDIHLQGDHETVFLGF